MIVLILCLSTLSAASTSNVLQGALSSPTLLRSLFSETQQSLGLRYSGREAQARLGVFRRAVRVVAGHDTESKGWELTLNKFSLMTESEKSQYLGLNVTLMGQEREFTTSHSTGDESIPESVNWIEKGAVTRAKDQARCGSCWTFGSTCSIEGAYQIGTGKLKSFSEQELLHCVYKMRNGCTGGFNSDAIEWVKESGHMATRRNLPYIAKDTSLGDCGFDKWENGLKAATVTDMVAVGNTEADSLTQLTQGPLATSVDVTNNFFYYKRGILRDTDCDPIELSHAIAAVAYSPDWFLIKNSWGDDWGLEGFIKMARDHHNCGIWIHPYRPIVSLTDSPDEDEEDEAATLDADIIITTPPPTEEPCEDQMSGCKLSVCGIYTYREMWCKKTCDNC